MKRVRVLAAVAIVVACSGACGRRSEQPASELKFERLTDTTGLSEGKPLLTRIEPYREQNGTLRVRGDVTFPDGVRIQISLYSGDTKEMLSRVQVVVQEHRFETPPIIGPGGPLPHGRYRFEYLAMFNAAWQTDDVMRFTNDGRSLRGPGIGRDPVGGARFYIVEERSL